MILKEKNKKKNREFMKIVDMLHPLNCPRFNQMSDEVGVAFYFLFVPPVKSALMEMAGGLTAGGC